MAETTENTGISLKGIDFIILGLTDNTGQIIADADKGLSKDGIVLIDGDGEGATTANITALEEAGQQQYGNNKVKRVNHGIPSPQVALTMLDMPYEVARKCVGYEQVKGGSVLASIKPHVALLIASHDFKGNFFFDGFANGEMIIPTRNHGTSNRNETDSNATFTYQSLSPIPNDTFLNNEGTQQPYKMYNSGTPDFKYEDMLKEVFGGYTGDNPIAHYVKASGSNDFSNTNQSDVRGHGDVSAASSGAGSAASSAASSAAGSAAGK